VLGSSVPDLGLGANCDLNHLILWNAILFVPDLVSGRKMAASFRMASLKRQRTNMNMNTNINEENGPPLDKRARSLPDTAIPNANTLALTNVNLNAVPIANANLYEDLPFDIKEFNDLLKKIMQKKNGAAYAFSNCEQVKVYLGHLHRSVPTAGAKAVSDKLTCNLNTDMFRLVKLQETIEKWGKARLPNAFKLGMMGGRRKIQRKTQRRKTRRNR
jgi:hypothetical protein